MDIKELQAYFESEAETFPGKVAYYYCDLKNPELCFGRNAEDRVVSASTIKVPVMMALFTKIKREHLSLKDELTVTKEQILDDSLVFEYGERKASLYELTVWMIVNSDNTSTNVLMSYLGFDAMNSYFKRIGLKQTRAERLMLDFDAVANGKNNYISAMDFYRCIRILKEEEEKDPYAKLALEILSRNRDYRSMCRYLYEGPYCAHKTGGLDDIIHDAGILRIGSREYFLGVFTSEFAPKEENQDLAERLIGRLSRKLFDSYKNEQVERESDQ